MLDKLLIELWEKNKESYIHKAEIENMFNKDKIKNFEALDLFISDIKSMPYFFFNALKDCDSDKLKKIIK